MKKRVETVLGCGQRAVAEPLDVFPEVSVSITPCSMLITMDNTAIRVWPWVCATRVTILRLEAAGPTDRTCHNPPLRLASQDAHSVAEVWTTRMPCLRLCQHPTVVGDHHRCDEACVRPASDLRA